MVLVAHLLLILWQVKLSVEKKYKEQYFLG